MALNLHISCPPSRFQEGLFGQILLHVMEILPFLERYGIYPEWRIAATHYGYGDEHVVIPGVLEPVNAPAKERKGYVDLAGIRLENCHVLGGDWHAVSALWHKYFRVPERITASLPSRQDFAGYLGLHYRGTDKQTTSWDSNYVSHEDFAILAEDLLSRRPDLKNIYLATDDGTMPEFLRSRWNLPIFCQRTPSFHKASDPVEGYPAKTDAAMRDCIALSRCAVVLQTSSALSGFAKIIQPDLEIYRLSASKMFSDVPYFPVAYIEPFRPSSPRAQKIIEQTMKDDWSSHPSASTFKETFAYKLRNRRVR